MVSDPIGDFLTRIRNGYLARKKEVAAPYSKTKEEIGRIFKKEGYIQKLKAPSLIGGSQKRRQSSKLKAKKGEKKTLVVELLYKDKQAAIENIRRISKPGVRVYVDKNNLPRVLSGYGMAIISTSKGLMTDKEARKKGLGGEVICKVW